MSLNDIKSALPDNAKDSRLGLDSMLGECGALGLSPLQARAVALAWAIASHNLPWIAAIEACAAKTRC